MKSIYTLTICLATATALTIPFSSVSAQVKKTSQTASNQTASNQSYNLHKQNLEQPNQGKNHLVNNTNNNGSNENLTQKPNPINNNPFNNNPANNNPANNNPANNNPANNNPANNNPASSRDASNEEVEEVKVSSVAVVGVEGEQRDYIYKLLRTQAGKTTNRLQVQEDIRAILGTGFISNVKVLTEDTAVGVRLTYQVKANPKLSAVKIEGNQVLPSSVINESFTPLYGRLLNFQELQQGINRVNQWYKDNGYVLAQVVDQPEVTDDGTVTLQVVEGVIEDIQVRFVNENGEEKDANGKPIKGQTQDYIIKREMQLKAGTVFNSNTANNDFRRIAGLGIFKDFRPKLNTAKDPEKVILVLDVYESKTLSFSPRGGFSSATGFFGGATFGADNIGGRNQKVGGNIQLNQRGLLFDVSYTDPWIGGDPYRTSYQIKAFRQQSIPQIFEGGNTTVELPNGDRPRVVRTGGGVSFLRPLSKNTFERSEWVASAGLQYQRVTIEDADGKLSPKDQLGNNLTFSGTANDDLLTVPLTVTRDKRNNNLSPTSGSFFRFSSDQSIPVGDSSIFYNRLRGDYRIYIPTKLTKFTEGCRKEKSKTAECPQAFAFNIQGGTVFGDLPPYEAFSLGGANSVRGFQEGNLGSGRSYAQASAEYRFPVLSFVNGALFFDAATDFGSGNDVPGNPAGVRNKPGSGYGYGVGVRLQTPLGPIRLDYGFNNEGDNNILFGVGEKF
jgi:outer membrane protein insertion porin family